MPTVQRDRCQNQGQVRGEQQEAMLATQKSYRKETNRSHGATLADFDADFRYSIHFQQHQADRKRQSGGDEATGPWQTEQLQQSAMLGLFDFELP